MTKTLYVSDMDGTLLGADARLSDTTRHMLRRLSEAGVLFTVATARTPATVQPLLQGTELTVPAIVMTGAALWHFDTLTYSHIHFIDAELEQAIDCLFAQAGITPFIYTLPAPDAPLHVWFGSRNLTNAERKFVDERSGLTLKRFYLNARPPQSESGHRLLHFAMGPVDKITALARRMRASVNCAVSCYPDTYNHNLALIEVFAPGVSKAMAVTTLKTDLGAHHLVVFGDNLNDLPMLRAADTAVAVANAVPQVLDAAHIVIGPNTTDAVPRYITGNLIKIPLNSTV